MINWSYKFKDLSYFTAADQQYADKAQLGVDLAQLDNLDLESAVKLTEKFVTIVRDKIDLSLIKILEYLVHMSENTL